MALPEETRGNLCLLCDVNDAGVIAGRLKVTNNSYYFPIWWMTAVLKVSLSFEVLTEWWMFKIDSGPDHLLFDVIWMCYQCQIKNYCVSWWLHRIITEEMISIRCFTEVTLVQWPVWQLMYEHIKVHRFINKLQRVSGEFNRHWR